MKYRPRVATLFSTASPSRCTPQNTCAGRHGDGVREHITSTRHRGNRRSHVPGPSTCACNLGRGVSALHPDASQQPDTAQPGDQGVVFKGIPRREKKPVKAPTEPNPLRSKQHHFTAYCRQSHSIFFRVYGVSPQTTYRRRFSYTVCRAVTSLFTNPLPPCGLNTWKQSRERIESEKRQVRPFLSPARVFSI